RRGTSQGLLALRAAVHLAALGPKGLEETAALCLRKAHYAAEQLKKTGLRPKFDRPFFNEFTVETGADVARLLARLRDDGYHAGLPQGRWYPQLASCLTVAVTEKRTRAEIDGLAAAGAAALGGAAAGQKQLVR